MEQEETWLAILDLFKQAEDLEYIGENVSQIEHALQAAYFAEKDGADEELIIAALLHDIGHWCYDKAEQMGGLGARYHEHIGGTYLRKLGFSKRLVGLVVSHVHAKRYLSSVDDEYRSHLSEASLATMEYQGGVMSEEEAHAFSSHPDCEARVKLRLYDEKSQVIGLEVPSLNAYKKMAERILN